MAALVLALGRSSATLAGGSIEGHLKAGVEDVDLDRYRLRFDPLGNLGNFAVREGGFQTFYSGSVTAVGETDLPGGLIWDTEARVDFDVFNRTQITAERYDRAKADVRTTVARELPRQAYGALELRVARYVEEFLPDLEATTFSVHGIYDREFGGDGYLHVEGGLRGGELENNPGDSYDELRLEAVYEHLPPDRTRVEVLPFHKPERAPSDWEFLFGHAMEFHKARNLLRYQGDAVLLADLSPDPPLPRAWNGAEVRPHVGIRESIFMVGGELLRRDLDSGNEVTRGTAFAGVEWSLSDFLALGVRDAVSLSDWRIPDPTRIRSDRLENHLVAEVSYVKDRSYLGLRAGLDSHYLDDFERLDYNRPHAGIYGSYDTGGKYRLAGYVRGAQESNLDEAGDFPDLSRWDSYAGFEYRFDPRQRMFLSYLRQRVNITGPQSEFDSAYLDETVRAAYRRRLRRGLNAEAGWQQKDESHEFFTENDRRDSSFFGSLDVTF